MQVIHILIISFGELQVSIGNFYVGIYEKCFAGVAEPLHIKPNIEKPPCFCRFWTRCYLPIFSSFYCTFPSL